MTAIPPLGPKCGCGTLSRTWQTAKAQQGQLSKPSPHSEPQPWGLPEVPPALLWQVALVLPSCTCRDSHEVGSPSVGGRCPAAGRGGWGSVME